LKICLFLGPLNYEVNIESCQLLIRCLKIWMFCFVEDDKIIFGIVNTMTEPA
jgi:hypothetical protein